MGKQSRRIRMKDTTMTKERMEEGQKKWEELRAIKDIHHELDIDEKYKKEASWIALELADENEDWEVLHKLLCMSPLLDEHIRGTMACFRWKFLGNKPLIEAPWKKGESYEETTMTINNRTKEIDIHHTNK